MVILIKKHKDRAKIVHFSNSNFFKAVLFFIDQSLQFENRNEEHGDASLSL